MYTYIKSVLEDAGWYEGRQKEIDYMVEEVKNSGLTVPNKLVEDFLKEFVNLELNFKIPNGEYGNIRIILDDVIPYIRERDLKTWSALANETLFPVGTLFEQVAYLLLSDSGKFYMAYEDKFYLLGNDFDSCLDIVINQKDMLRINYKN